MNVVEVLDKVIDYHPEWVVRTTEIEAARDAVAEMIEALRAARDEMKRATHVRLPSYIAAQELIDAALTRCGGQ